MSNIDILTNMLKLQQRLNDQTNGLGWENGYTKQGRLISWKRCIYMECAELIDSFAWKHWKNILNPTNWENIHMEIVDIWHFILSLLLETYKEERLDFLAMQISSINVFRDFCKEASKPHENLNEIYGILNDAELIIHKCSGFGFDLGELLATYFTLAMKCGLNLELLHRKYIGKNVLNAFRQSHGYKDGSYKKKWKDKEDNEILAQILDQDLDFDTIYRKLDELYKGIDQ